MPSRSHPSHIKSYCGKKNKKKDMEESRLSMGTERTTSEHQKDKSSACHDFLLNPYHHHSRSRRSSQHCVIADSPAAQHYSSTASEPAKNTATATHQDHRWASTAALPSGSSVGMPHVVTTPTDASRPPCRRPCLELHRSLPSPEFQCTLRRVLETPQPLHLACNGPPPYVMPLATDLRVKRNVNEKGKEREGKQIGTTKEESRGKVVFPVALELSWIK